MVKVDADFADEYPDGDATCTEAYASLCRTGEALLGELDRHIRLTIGMPQAAATALAVIDGAGEPLTPSQVSDRVLIASATMTATLDLLEHRGWIRRIPNPGDRRSVLVEITPDGRAVVDQLLPGIRTIERSILSALTPDERAHLLDMLAKILARTAEAAAEQPEPLTGQRIRPARLGGLPQRADLNGQQLGSSLRVSVHPVAVRGYGGATARTPRGPGRQPRVRQGEPQPQPNSGSGRSCASRSPRPPSTAPSIRGHGQVWPGLAR